MNPTYSSSSLLYKDSRPTYDREIYEYLNTLVKSFDNAWDCACGNGQVSTVLSESFKNVLASDSCQFQLSKAPSISNITYQHAKEEIIAPNEHFDLITVATAIHWLNRDKFYNEADRVLKNGGILAVWGYSGIHLHEDIDDTLQRIVYEKFMPYYPENIKIAFNKYEDISTPFSPLNTPEFKVSRDWSYHNLVNYLESFSAMQNYMAQHGKSGKELFYDELLESWGGNPNEIKTLTWKLHTHFSRK